MGVYRDVVKILEFNKWSFRPSVQLFIFIHRGKDCDFDISRRAALLYTCFNYYHISNNNTTELKSV
jgi:hypothetical protein